MGKGTITILFVISLFIISMSLISAAETKLLCLDNGESVEFSKCNSLIPDRTCQNDRGCQYCVSEISSGVYCPRNINECNSLGFTCEDNSNSNLIPEDNKITSTLNQTLTQIRQAPILTQILTLIQIHQVLILTQIRILLQKLIIKTNQIKVL